MNFPIYEKSPWHLAIAVALAISPQSVLAQTSASESFPVPKVVPAGTSVEIGGSNAMEKVNAGLKGRFEKKFTGTKVNVAYSDVDAALKDLIDGKVDVVALGRPLTAEEKAKGLAQLSFARHKMAIFTSANNLYPPERASQKSISSEQFAKIFRGEINNWSEVGGKSGEIKVIDRPNTSESRQALSRYNVFPADSLKTGSNAVQSPSDRTEDIIKELGNNGISYAPAAEVVDNPAVKVLWLHNTPPTDPRYPFSLPLSYVYKAGNPSEKVKAFLGYAIAPENRDIITQARFLQPREEVVISEGTAPVTGTTPTTSTATEATPTTSPATDTALVPPATTTEDNRSFPWWLLLPLLGIPLLLWLLKGKKTAPAPVAAVAPVAPVAPVIATAPSRIVLTPRDCRNAYAYWEIPSAKISEIRSQAGQKLALRLHDVTDIANMDVQAPHSTKQFACDENLQDLHLPVAVDNRDYVAELGYETNNGEWVRLARSEHVRVPACTLEAEIGTGMTTKLQATPTTLQTHSPTRLQDSSTTLQTDSPTKLQDSSTTLQTNSPTKFQDSSTKLQSSTTQFEDSTAGMSGALPIAAAVTGGIAASTLLGKDGETVEATSRIILVPRNCKEAYVYWEVSDDAKEVLRQRGGQQLMLRVYQPPSADGIEPFPQMIQAFECNELDWDRHVPIPADNLDYVAELGYLTGERAWLSLATSSPVRVPAC